MFHTFFYDFGDGLVLLVYNTVCPYGKYIRANKYLPKTHENICQRVVIFETFLFDGK